MLRFIARLALPLSLAASLLAACTAREREVERETTRDATTETQSSPASRAASPIVDDFGDTLHEPPGALRVVSLNPTTTELAFAFGAGALLVGRSRWDAWPAEAARVHAVGDGIRPNVEAVLATRPTLVILYASADNRPAARALRAAGVATLAVRVDSIAQFRRVALLLGAVLQRGDAARTVVDSVDATLARVRRLTEGGARPTVLWRAWDAPLMVIGGGSYFTELVDIAGGRNVFADDPRPSPQVSFEEVVRRDPDRVLAGDNAAAAQLRADPRWRTLSAVRENRIVVVEGDLLARPSVRLGEAAVHLATRLHPELASQLARAPR